MSSQSQQSENKFPNHYSRRKDMASAQIVDEGIQFQNMRRTEYAANYLKFKGISVEVATRVLSRPSQRRIISRIA